MFSFSLRGMYTYTTVASNQVVMCELEACNTQAPFLVANLYVPAASPNQETDGFFWMAFKHRDL